MKPIGGFFELELGKQKEYHTDALKLNLGRNALRYILEARGVKKLYIPFYICDAIIRTLRALKIDYSCYPIDSAFRPVIDFNVNYDEYILIVNYFGIANVKIPAGRFKNIIIDNSQAFFEKPGYNTDTFYSPRKFFGVPDGAYLYTTKRLKQRLERDVSANYSGHLLMRIDEGPGEAYRTFLKNEKAMSKKPLKIMSNLTETILKSINYGDVIKIRHKNFLHYHRSLNKINECKININKIKAPMVYPLLVKNKGLKNYLIKNNIFIATYWKEVKNYARSGSFESYLVNNLVSLPVDQRYGLTEIQYIIEKIKKYLKIF